VTAYAKATRMSGLGFTAELQEGAEYAEVDYASRVGGVTDPGWIQVAPVPAWCMDVAWPCRMFVVEPAVGAHVAALRYPPGAVGCTQVRVLAEVPGHWVFGSQGVHVAAILDAWAALPAGTQDALRAATDVARGAPIAYSAALKGAEDGGRVGLGANIAAGQGTGGDVTTPVVVALMARHLIGAGVSRWDQAAYDLLTGPWADLVGPAHPDDT